MACSLEEILSSTLSDDGRGHQMFLIKQEYNGKQTLDFCNMDPIPAVHDKMCEIIHVDFFFTYHSRLLIYLNFK